jgi:hypothetical protein
MSDQLRLTCEMLNMVKVFNDVQEDKRNGVRQ